jgi:membrane-associated phospholipid phosphatase
VGSIGLLIALDDEAQDWSQDIRDPEGDDLYKTIGRYGEGIVYVPVSVGLFVAGLVRGHDGLMHLGARTSVSLLWAGLTSGSTKMICGRPRPSHHADAHKFRPFSGRTSFPSGHTAMAFALSSSLALEIDNLWASVVLYAAASAAGLSRVMLDSHWLSDVAAGAVIGHLAARLARAKLWAEADSSPVLQPTGDGVLLGWRWAH